MTFQEKMNAILQFSIGTVLPTVVKDEATQAKITPYIGLAVGVVTLLEALFGHKAAVPVAVSPATV